MSIERVIGAAIVSVAVWVLSDSKKSASPELQRMFERFHDEIKLEENDERLKLRTKRELLLKTLRKKLAAHSLGFESFDQGSYAMRTGVVPKDGNYDIDVGLIFDCSQERFPNPVELKSLVHDALVGSKRNIAIRRACVTVTYFYDQMPDYHVDLAIYVRATDGSLLLAKGRRHSETAKCEWVPAAPQELTQFVLAKFSGDEQAQYRRCIRYLKRWRDENFVSGAPVSIALTVAATMWFEPKQAEDGAPFDLAAIHSLVKRIRQNFGNNFSFDRLAVPLPGFSRTDLMSKLTPLQMAFFKERLRSLENALSKCYGDMPVVQAARILATPFGRDFLS
ncbi:cyclic GMP-AMP synthase DncV-like nucleotidyltransferase [Undibacterium sp.]|uniref:cyclic GMP-AMP synthase DncV-like nucleotidyltransferase n=1 Tax=Undibacterium sp. TaxID=1914977 RepID=UPI0025FE22F5|nr:hypothetical protein [Undibacterium sp.]